MTLLFALVFITAIAGVVFRVVRFMLRQKKGRITVSLAPRQFGFGQPVNGVITVRSGQPLGPGRLVVELVCTEREHDDNRARVRYQERINLAEALSVSGNEPKSLPFTIMTPPSNHSGVERAYNFRSWTQLRVVGSYHIKGLDLVGAARLNLPDPS